MTGDTLRASDTALPDDKANDDEIEADAERDKQARTDAFQRAYCRWLQAKTGIDHPDLEHDDASLDARINEERIAEREFLVCPAAQPRHVWQKLEAFESVLSDELRAGVRPDSPIMLAAGSIKADLLNLDLCD